MTELGVTELTFANGAKVVLKPTTFKDDEIILTSFRKGGQSLYPAADKVQLYVCRRCSAADGHRQLLHLLIFENAGWQSSICISKHRAPELRASVAKAV